MQYVEVVVKTSSAGIEPAAAALTALGYDSLVLDDQAEYRQFLAENRACWDYIDETLEQKLEGLSQITLYLEADGSVPQRLQQIRDCLARLKARRPEADLGPLTVTAAPLAQADWADGWKANYPPQFVGRNLCILPHWLPLEAAQGRIPVILDPGLTFGTGAHPSTQMCLAALEDYLTPGSRVADLGSGSGILSIAALRLGAACAVGVDIDPKAEDMARENAAYNGIGPGQFRAFTGNVAAGGDDLAALGGGYDLVLVNIVADVILALCPVLKQIVRPGGVVICSGILDTRLDEVSRGLAAGGLTVVETRAQGEWRCLVARREVG